MEISKRSLEHMPIQLFAMIMGLSGFAIMLAKAYHLLDFPFWVYEAALFVDCTLFLVIFTGYMMKLLIYTQAVKEEFNHPVKSSFMATISISFLLLSIAFYDYNPLISILLWYIGAPLQLMFTLIIIRYWIRNELKVVHSNPAWFIPIVGNVLVPIIGVEAAPISVSLFFFATGIFFWIVLFIIMMYRLLFHFPLAKKLIPTFFIFIAPPSVGFISYFKITDGSVDIVSMFLYFVALFILLLLLFMVRMYDVKEFFISWWAYTFPLTAMSIATLTLHMAFHSTATYIASVLMITLTSLVITFVALKTFIAFKAHKICISEEG